MALSVMMSALASVTAYVLARNDSSRALAEEITLTVQNPSTVVTSGIQLICYGPFMVPPGARSLHKMLPMVDMDIVHHMIMFGGDAIYGAAQPRANSDACYRGRIVYAWARTGQKTPLGLDFDSGDAFAVGLDTNIRWFAVQIHYQQLKYASINDKSGIKLWFRPELPKRKLEVELMMSAQIRIPPRVYFDECVACRIQRGGEVIAYRNHAHRLARDLWSEHYDVNGRRLADFG